MDEVTKFPRSKVYADLLQRKSEKTAKRKTKKQQAKPKLPATAEEASNPLPVPVPDALAVATPIHTVEPIAKSRRHWFLGSICLLIALGLGGFGLAVNLRYNQSYGQTNEWGVYFAGMGVAADCACLFLPSVYSLLWRTRFLVSSIIVFLIWLGAAGYSVQTTAAFVEQNVGDTVAARATPAGKTTTVEIKNKFRTVKRTVDEHAAAKGAPDPGAHAIATWFAWFGYPIQEQTIAMLRAALLAILPACAGLIFSASMILFGRRQQS